MIKINKQGPFFHSHKLINIFSLQVKKEMEDPAKSTPKKSALWEIFQSFCGNDKEMDWTELQKIMNYTMKDGESESLSPCLVFSLPHSLLFLNCLMLFPSLSLHSSLSISPLSLLFYFMSVLIFFHSPSHYLFHFLSFSSLIQ